MAWFYCINSHTSHITNRQRTFRFHNSEEFLDWLCWWKWPLLLLCSFQKCNPDAEWGCSVFEHNSPPCPISVLFYFISEPISLIVTVCKRFLEYHIKPDSEHVSYFLISLSMLCKRQPLHTQAALAKTYLIFVQVSEISGLSHLIMGKIIYILLNHISWCI